MSSQHLLRWKDALEHHNADPNVYRSLLEGTNSIERLALLHYDNDKLLENSMRYGHLEIVRFLLDEGIYGDISETHMLQAMESNPQILDLLLEYGATPHKTSNRPLLLAVELGSLEMFEKLLKNEAKLDCIVYGNYIRSFAFGRELTLAAVKHGRFEMMKILFQDHVGIRRHEDCHSSESSYEVRHYKRSFDRELIEDCWREAIQHNRIEIMQYLLSENASILANAFVGAYCRSYKSDDFEKSSPDSIDLLMSLPWRDNFYKEMLSGFSDGGNLYGFRALVIAGYDKDQLLLKALRPGNVEIVKYLLDSGANIKQTAVGSWIGHKLRFHSHDHVVREKPCSMVRLLLTSGAEVTISGAELMEHKFGWPNITESCLKCCEELLRSGYKAPLFVETVLETAAASGNIDFLKLALNNNIDLAVYGKETVKKACDRGELDTAKFLIENGAPISFSKRGPSRFLKWNPRDGSLQVSLVGHTS